MAEKLRVGVIGCGGGPGTVGTSRGAYLGALAEVTGTMDTVAVYDVVAEHADYGASCMAHAIAYTDLPNGIIILLACLLATPFVYLAVGGLPQATQTLDPGYFAVVNEQFGAHPFLKVGGFFLATMLLIMGVQSMYQKFYSARTPKDARKAVILWTVGTVFVETVVVIIAVFAYSKFKDQLDLSIPKVTDQ